MTTTPPVRRTPNVPRTVEQPSDRAGSRRATPVPGIDSSRRSLRSHAARWVWILAGALIGLVTLGWMLWGGPSPLLSPGALDRPVTCWRSPLVVVAALAIWGCLAQAAHHKKSRHRT